MLIPGIDNQVIELNILGYQYPTATKGKWDPNWLSIYFHLHHREQPMEVTDPSLTAFEVEEWAEWMEQLAELPATIKSTQYFTEPNLRLELLNAPTDAVKQIRVLFEQELKPKELRFEDIDFYIDLALTNEELQTIAAHLRAELAPFPVRGEMEEEEEED